MNAVPRRVLLAEDSFLIALEIRAVLTDLGFSVVGPAATSQEALDLLEQNEDVAFAVLDVNLRGGTCAPIVQALRDRNTPFCLVTGYSDPDLGEGILGSPSPPIVSKPFRQAALVEAIGSFLPPE